jgi:hypothetical protein
MQALPQGQPFLQLGPVEREYDGDDNAQVYSRAIQVLPQGLPTTQPPLSST